MSKIGIQNPRTISNLSRSHEPKSPFSVSIKPSSSLNKRASLKAQPIRPIRIMASSSISTKPSKASEGTTVVDTIMISDDITYMLGALKQVGLNVGHDGIWMNTFTSILDMAGVLLPFLKWFIGGSGSKGPKLLNFVVRSPWNTIGAIGEVKQPLLFLSGLQDEVVLPFHIKMLYAKAAARNPQCNFVEFPSGMHMDKWLFVVTFTGK